MGAAISALYTCAVTMLGDRFTGGALVGGSAAFTLAYASGSAVGSSVTGSAMELVAPRPARSSPVSFYLLSPV
ncbi:hypothetical protein T190_12330 [Sinorhizobium meliloti CCBAU 01290]|nr:hypothetical protein T190_12330 [Sinorhizobium meliloti CCBAU 01290]